MTEQEIKNRIEKIEQLLKHCYSFQTIDRLKNELETLKQISWKKQD